MPFLSITQKQPVFYVISNETVLPGYIAGAKIYLNVLTLIDTHHIQHFPMKDDEGCCGNMLMNMGTKAYSGETAMHNLRQMPLSDGGFWKYHWCHCLHIVGTLLVHWWHQNNF